MEDPLETFVTGGFTECKIQVASVTSCHPVVSARMNPGDF
jgi:hypothetical protein